MPTFTTIALETLVEPRLRDSYKNSSNSKQQTAKFVPDNVDIKEVEKENNQPKPSTSNHIYISPALYITPQPTPILHSSPGSLSPSPYVVNRKGRGGNAFNSLIGGFESNSTGGEDKNGGDLQVEEMVDDGFLAAEVIADRNENSIVDDDFFNPRWESPSVDKLSNVSNQGSNCSLMDLYCGTADNNQNHTWCCCSLLASVHTILFHYCYRFCSQILLLRILLLLSEDSLGCWMLLLLLYHFLLMKTAIHYCYLLQMMCRKTSKLFLMPFAATLCFVMMTPFATSWNSLLNTLLYGPVIFC